MSEGFRFEHRQMQAAEKVSADGGGHNGTQTYRLKFFEEDERPAKDFEFEAEDAYQALFIAHKEARRRSAELWRDGKKICLITRQADNLWEIGAADGDGLD